MNRSIFGPVVFHGAAPDDGNMRLLNMVGTEAQKERWLQPIIDGEVQSAFAMTEPDGCGSDPSMTYTRAERDGDRWVIYGRKHYITGAESAKHFILMARTGEDDRNGLTAFLFHARPAGLAHPPPHPDHGAGGAWRPLRAGIRRARDHRRQRADEGRRRAARDADPARPGAADALHALDRHGPPRAGDRHGAHRDARRPSAPR